MTKKTRHFVFRIIDHEMFVVSIWAIVRVCACVFFLSLNVVGVKTAKCLPRLTLRLRYSMV